MQKVHELHDIKNLQPTGEALLPLRIMLRYTEGSILAELRHAKPNAVDGLQFMQRVFGKQKPLGYRWKASSVSWSTPAIFGLVILPAMEPEAFSELVEKMQWAWNGLMGGTASAPILTPYKEIADVQKQQDFFAQISHLDYTI